MKLRGDPEKKPKDYSTPCEKPSTRVFTMFEQGQPTKFVKQTSDRSCIAIIFFDKTGSTIDVEHVRVAGYLWPYTGAVLQRHTPSGDELRTDKQYFELPENNNTHYAEQS